MQVMKTVLVKAAGLLASPAFMEEAVERQLSVINGRIPTKDSSL